MHTHARAQRHTLKHAATQPLSNKSAALLHPVRLNPVNVLQTCCPVLSCVVPLAKFSTVQHQESCLAGMKSCPEKPISGLHHLAPPPPSRRSPSCSPSPSLSSSFSSRLFCRSESCQLPLSQRSVPISALCSPLSPSLSLCVSASFIALSLSHSVSMQHPSSSFHRSALSHPSFSPSLLPCLLL